HHPKHDPLPDMYRYARSCRLRHTFPTSYHSTLYPDTTQDKALAEPPFVSFPCPTSRFRFRRTRSPPAQSWHTSQLQIFSSFILGEISPCGDTTFDHRLIY